MLKRFAFRRKMYYLCIAKRREPADTGFSPLFYAKMASKKGFFTKHIEKFICRRKNFLGLSGFFSGQVGERIDDIGVWNVKRNLFFKPAFFHTKIIYAVLVYNGCFYYVFIYTLSQWHKKREHSLLGKCAAGMFGILCLYCWVNVEFSYTCS